MENEKTYLDIIHELAEKVESSAIPYQQKRVIVSEINIVWQMLWPWVTEGGKS